MGYFFKLKGSSDAPKKEQDDGTIYEPTDEEIKILERINNKEYNQKIQKDLEKLQRDYYKSLDPKYLNDMKTLIKNFELTKTKPKPIKKEKQTKEIKPIQEKKIDIFEFTQEDQLNFIKKYNMYYQGSNEEALIKILTTDSRYKNKPNAKKQVKDLIEKLFYDLNPDFILNNEGEEAKPKPLSKAKRSVVDLDEFYDIVNTVISGRRVYKRSESRLADYGFSKEDVYNLLNAKRFFDFYPTPKVCINDEQLINIIDGSETVFDPAGGLGNLVYHALSFNPDLKIDINEFSENTFTLLKKLYGDLLDNAYNQNYLKMIVEKPYDLYLLNPPFSFGGDRKYYYNFFFKMLYDMNMNINKTFQYGIFISPPLTDLREKEGNTVDHTSILKTLSMNKLNDILNNQFKFGLSKKQLTKIKKNTWYDEDTEENNEIADALSYFDIAQLQLIKTCSGFGGTKIVARVYLVISYSN